MTQENTNVPPTGSAPQFPAVNPSYASAAPQPAAPAMMPPPWWSQPPRQKSFFRRMLTGLFVAVLIVSILMNAYLLVIIGSQFESPFATTVLQEGDKDKVVAVYRVTGTIDDEAAGSFAAFARDILKKEEVKAVVLRVESPGGSVSASDQMHHQVKELQKAGKRVVVSMGGVAASGGYYISAPADEIVAEPSTLTGSIGVIMMWAVFKEGLSKLGIEPIVLKSTHAQEWKDELSMIDKPTDAHRRHLRELLDDMQSQFENVVREGRGHKLSAAARQTPQPIEKTATTGPAGGNGNLVVLTDTAPFNGKIYRAKEAKELGLIDSIGYQSDAIDRAKSLAGLANPKVVRYDRRRGLLSSLVDVKINSGVQVDTAGLENLRTPQMLMLWQPE